MYAIPLKRLVLLQVISRTSRTLPTELKNSSKSLARIRCDNCIQNIVLASRSSGLISSSGGGGGPRLGGGDLPPLGGCQARIGEGERRLSRLSLDLERRRSLLKN